MKSLQVYIKEACEEQDGARFRNDYSGRGMYGKNCIGIVGTMRDCMRVVGITVAALFNEEDPHFFIDGFFDNVKTDSMGYDIIMYWPDLEPIEEEEDFEG